MEKEQISIIGCGWLGFALAKHLVKQGHVVQGSTTTAAKLPQLRKAGIEAHLLRIGAEPDQSDWPQALPQSNTLCITLPPGRKREKVEKWYPEAVGLIIQQALAVGPVQRIYFTSSTGVYGEQAGIVTEDSPLSPTRPSANAMVAAEQQVRDSGIPWIILRLAGLYGPDRHPGRWLAGKKDLSGGNDPVNLVHQEDVIQVMTKLMNSDLKNELFLLSADEHPLKRDFYPSMSEQLGLEPPTYLPNGKAAAKRVNNEKIKRAIGYEFKSLSNF